ncbi:MAG: hypothetical protein V5B39_04455 [Accumulibacter sp.]|jgi:hypothetical protein|uniref:hypothetical protein n=1 Tax=Accumulibacter sp. TaxID=2053492 RepID=UPI002FC37410
MTTAPSAAPTTNQAFRDGIPHETKAYANAKPAHNPVIPKQKQRLEKTVLNSRSQEVSREMAVKSADMTFVGLAKSGGFNEKPRKTRR